jgi:hypothetical protein
MAIPKEARRKVLVRKIVLVKEQTYAMLRK